MTIAIYDKEDETIDSYDLKQVYASAYIDSHFELIGRNTLKRIGVQTLVQDRYVINNDDLKHIVMILDSNVKRKDDKL